MRTWQKRTAGIMLSLAVFAGVLVVAPTAALAAAYVSCSPHSQRTSSIVSAHPIYHDIYYGLTSTGGLASYAIKDISNGVIIQQGLANNSSISGHITVVFGSYRLTITCYSGSGSAYIA